MLVAHGSRRAVANAGHLELCELVARRSGRVVLPAFLEAAEPAVPDALDAAAATGAAEVSVLPYFLAAGNHTSQDLPALVEAAGRRHPRTRFHQLDHVGAAPAMVRLVADLVALS